MGLKQALGELSGGGAGGGGGARGGAWSELSSPSSSSGGAPQASPDNLLSLQSDEAKAQRQEAERQEAEFRQAERREAELREAERRDAERELRLERQQRQKQSLTFAQERHIWQDEKERVLQYQAQLQLSYVETLQRNQALELRMGQLHDKLTSSTSPASPPPLPSLSLPLSLTLSPPPSRGGEPLRPRLYAQPAGPALARPLPPREDRVHGNMTLNARRRMSAHTDRSPQV
ncbi:hypothetical protein ANANG_G00198400 [Anguilla anguilla]|uniref:Uncharacterized protein n=1 Tax=Anguilla anguilla TaxID=7936 RepID=A0A9D3RTH6_ANGAN|nr:hypothetical protein ANANG_G00198400 [Anguilla anguilla]